MFSIALVLFVALASVHARPLANQRRDDAPFVETTHGPVQGFYDDGVSVFHEIPFAEPPIGGLRFRAPQPPANWTDTLDCTTTSVKKICPQQRVVEDIVIGGEDCLYLHVYAPAIIDEPLPVHAFIFGGGYTIGDGWEFGYYDGVNVAKERNAVVVTMNYRLSVFGFLALPELAAEDPDSSTGNYALQDQRLALQWIQDNIAAFGGDPDRVMLFGESAGAFSVCWHLVSPLSEGLFQRAVLESGNCDTIAFYQNYENATDFGYMYTTAMGCNATEIDDDELFLNCLRLLSTADLLTTITSDIDPNWPYAMDVILEKIGMPPELAAALAPPLSPVMPFGPCIDGSEAGLLDTPLTLMQEGKFVKVPTIMGSNNDEGSLFVPLVAIVVPGAEWPIGQNSLKDVLGHFFNESTSQQIQDLYPEDYYKDDDERVAVILRDYFFACPTRRVARAISSQGVPFWVYHFHYAFSFEDGLEYDLLGNYHSSELYFVWGNEWPPVFHSFSQADFNMSDTFTAYWSNMAASGDPNVGDWSPPSPLFWPQYNESSPLNIVMDVPTSIENDYQGAGNCDFWDRAKTYWE